jgi:hypothetical protein
MKKINLVLGFLLLFTFGCQRATQDSSSVRISFPSGNIGALSCTQCLKLFVLNIEGAGFEKIVKTVQHDNMSEPGTELSGTFELVLPSGKDRKFQVIAIYLDANKVQTVHYASLVKDLNGTDTDIPLNLTSLGVFKDGKIVGRYLTQPEDGPTGNVNVFFSTASNPNIKVQIKTEQMINGWMNLFASENFPITYKMDDGTVLFQDVTMNSLVPLTGGTYSKYVARIHYPATFYRSNGPGGSWEAVTESQDTIYGFFGSATYTAGNYVCLEHNASSPSFFVNLSSSSTGSPNLTYHQNYTMAPDVYGVGGTNGGSGADPANCSTISTANRIESHRINVNKAQLDGQGNDTASGMMGAFSFVYASSYYQKYSVNVSGDITLAGLPGLLGSAASGTPYDGIKLFSKLSATTNSNDRGYDEITCSDTWLTANGFTLVTNFTLTPSISSDQVTFKLPPSVFTVNDKFLVCPTKSNELKKLGGMYLGTLVNAQVMSSPSSLSFSGAQTLSVTLYNTGQADATLSNPTITSTGNEMTYTGGSYPGTGGTCGTTVPANNSCTVSITYAGGSGSNGSFGIEYLSTNGTTPLTVNLNGTP